MPGGELFGGRRVVLFGLPGAFTGMCSTQHVPSFIRVADAAAGEGDRRDRLRRGQRPARDAGLERGDRRRARPGSGCSPTRTAPSPGRWGSTFDNPGAGLFGRSKRYALLAEDGVVKVLNLETSRTDCELSGGETMLAAV